MSWTPSEWAFIEQCRAGSPPPDPLAPKACSRCLVVKPAEDFHRNSANKDGMAYHCKPCTKEYHQQRKTKTPLAVTGGVSSSRKDK